MSTLHVDHVLSVGWAHPILAALNETPSLAAKHARWRDSRLSDLVFAIEIRYGTMHESVRLLSDALQPLSKQLGPDTSVDEHVRRGAAYRFRDQEAVRRVILGAGTFITEARACFENLADFYGDFVDHYFGEELKGKKHRYEAIAALSRDTAWIADLRARRHDLVHARAPWLGFHVTENPRGYEPFLAFDWRPSAAGHESIVSFRRLLAIRGGLDDVAAATRSALASKVRSES